MVEIHVFIVTSVKYLAESFRVLKFFAFLVVLFSGYRIISVEMGLRLLNRIETIE